MAGGTVEILEHEDRRPSAGPDGRPRDRPCAARPTSIPDMTVSENLELGAYRIKDRRKKKGELDGSWAIPDAGPAGKNAKANTPSGGMQQMLAVARGLACCVRGLPPGRAFPRPGAGGRRRIGAILSQDLNEAGRPVLVEQNAVLALEIADGAYAVENGSVTAREGQRGTKLMQSELIRKAYLGL